MQTVLLAAGEGTRMRPLTHSTPKPMLPVADRPLCAHTADDAVAAGTDELVVVVGYEADAVRDYFGERYRGVPVRYAVQDEQLGTAHAVLQARDYLDGPFVVLNGDDLYDAAAVAALFDADGPAMGAYRVDDPTSYGVLSLDGDRVTDIVEKPADPPSNRVNVGAYRFPAAAREWLDVERSERGEYEITDVVARTLSETGMGAVDVERWLGVGRPWELLEANEWKLGELERRINTGDGDGGDGGVSDGDGDAADGGGDGGVSDGDGGVSDDAELRGPVVVEAGATIEPGVVIEGPVLVREGAEIGPNAYLRGSTYVGEGCHVGSNVEVKNSVLMAGANVPHLSYLGDSLLGPAVNLGAGTQVANLRHDDGDVEQTVKGERVSTGRRKYGIVAGDGAKTGVNTSLSPGLVLSPGATTLPGEQVLRDR